MANVTEVFAVVTVDGVDLGVYSEAAAKLHKRSLKREFDMASTIYMIVADVVGSQAENAVDAINDAIRDRVDAHTITKTQRQKIEADFGVRIVKL